MNADYLSKIENPRMKERLLNLNNIPVIEDILCAESQRLERLQKLKEGGKLNLGDKVSPDELTELFPQICTEVDAFLGIQDGGVPKFGYYNLFRPGLTTIPILLMYASSAIPVVSTLASSVTGQSHLSSVIDVADVTLQFAVLFEASEFFHLLVKRPHYHPSSKSITLERVARTDLIPTAGHEYTHYVQCSRAGLGLSNNYSIFMEGHAIGVGKQLADDYLKREDNEAFLYNVSATNVGQLKSVYIWMCKKLGQQPRGSLSKTKTSDRWADRWVDTEPTSHAIGNALLSIYELCEGKKVYRQMIHGDFQFTPRVTTKSDFHSLSTKSIYYKLFYPLVRKI